MSTGYIFDPPLSREDFLDAAEHYGWHIVEEGGTEFVIGGPAFEEPNLQQLLDEKQVTSRQVRALRKIGLLSTPGRTSYLWVYTDPDKSVSVTRYGGNSALVLNRIAFYNEVAVFSEHDDEFGAVLRRHRKNALARERRQRMQS